MNKYAQSYRCCIYLLLICLTACSNKKTLESHIPSNHGTSSSQIGTPLQLPYSLYVRGAFNGWGSTHAFKEIEPATYEATLLVAPGNHEFKLASKDWRHQWVVDNSVSLGLNTTYSLTNGGQGNFLFVKRTATFKFVVSFADAKKPTLHIAKLRDQTTASSNPHKGNTSKVVTHIAGFKGKEKVTVSTPNIAATHRNYIHSTSQNLRDPIPSSRSYSEAAGDTRVRSENLLFDALFALAMEEMRLNSVNQIRDGNYNNGESIDCECFETGAKWHYVWTRDLAYSAHLSLAMLNPERTKNSLEFKLSPFREGLSRPTAVPGDQDGFQIVQDTGTGGSWPISTDRVSWTFGAEKLIENLSGEQRQLFISKAYRALKNTIAIDRVAAFDGSDGLYSGEQSFLDWREQSYASWIVNDIASLGSAKSLSTNIGHFQALRLASKLARLEQEPVNAIRFDDWASDLKAAINKKFWLEQHGLYSSLTGPHFDNSTLEKYDLLGLSLAIITGIADERRAKLIVENYPHGPMGAPVIFPQQPGIPIYHNRAIWPFVTSYGLKAAIQAGNSAVAEEAYRTLLRSAALNMSNMENLEWLSGQALLLDENNPELSGPVINSQRQLWSVAGYLSAVIEGVFGVHTNKEGLHIAPAIPAVLLREEFGDSSILKLLDLKLRGVKIDIEIQLPEKSEGEGFLTVEHIWLNDQTVHSNIPWSALSEENTITVRLGKALRDKRKMTRVKGDPFSTDDPDLFAPVEPVFDSTFVADDSVYYHLYKNGRFAKTVSAEQIVNLSRELNTDIHCYTLRSVEKTNGNSSHSSPAHCGGPKQEININDPRVEFNQHSSSTETTAHNIAFKNFGKPEDIIKISNVVIEKEGRFALQLRYHNDHNLINLGITNGVKWLEIFDASGTLVTHGVIQMPHAKVVDGNKPWVLSTPLLVNLPSSTYSVRLSDFMNMSYLQANTTFTGNGGTDGAKNSFALKSLVVTSVAP